VAEQASAGAATPPPPRARIVLDERFTTNQQRWPDDSESTGWLDTAGYHLFARQPGRFVAVGAPNLGWLGDVVVTATFHKAAGPAGGGYGLILRDQSPGTRDGLDQGGRYYVLEAGDRGEVGIWRREGDHWVDLVPWTHADAVRTAQASNQLAAQAVGSRLSLTVNGLMVASVDDPALSVGGVGVFAGGDFNEVMVEGLQVQALDQR
jgi:hypothetical protein